MSSLSDPHSLSHPNLKDSAAEEPTPQEWDDLMGWLRDHPYDDEAPELAEEVYHDPDDERWWAEHSGGGCGPTEPSPFDLELFTLSEFDFRQALIEEGGMPW